MTSITGRTTDRSGKKVGEEKEKGSLGRPVMNPTSKFEQSPRVNRSLDWKDMGADACQWMMKMDEFVKFRIKSPGFFQRLNTISKISDWFAP